MPYHHQKSKREIIKPARNNQKTIVNKIMKNGEKTEWLRPIIKLFFNNKNVGVIKTEMITIKNLKILTLMSVKHDRQKQRDAAKKQSNARRFTQQKKTTRHVFIFDVKKLAKTKKKQRELLQNEVIHEMPRILRWRVLNLTREFFASGARKMHG